MATAAAKALIRRLEQSVSPRHDPTEAESARFDWYAAGCPCGLPPGECRDHPRARANQRPPEGDWRTLLILAGRGFGKTRAACEWVRHQAESGQARRIALVGSTAADVRDVLVEGESGILAVCPPWDRPRYEPSKRRLTWPNGAQATTFSAEEPDRLRGPQHDAALCDELAAWGYAEATWTNLLLGLRRGSSRVLVATTPKPVATLRKILAEPTTVTVRGSTFDNRANLSEAFFTAIVSTYAHTRIGEQEILGKLLENVEGAYFPRFDAARHVTEGADYQEGQEVLVGVDAGVSRWTSATFFTVRQIGPYSWRVSIFGDYISEGRNSDENAQQIKALAAELPCKGRIDRVWVDPAATARTGIGPAAYASYERVFGSKLSRSPVHQVADGLLMIELLLDQGNLLLHPRATATKTAFLNYQRVKLAGEFGDHPSDDHPYADSMDSLRYGIRSRWPEGFTLPLNTRSIHVSKLY